MGYYKDPQGPRIDMGFDTFLINTLLYEVRTTRHRGQGNLAIEAFRSLVEHRSGLSWRVREGGDTQGQRGQES